MAADGHDNPADAHIHAPRGRYMHLTAAVRELLMEKGFYDEAAETAMIGLIDGVGPEVGARIVARAWTDPDFKARLMKAPRKTLAAEFDIDVVVADLVVLENTDTVHNVFVCTLCSCFPVFVLGRPPDWYKGREYRSRVVHEPRAVLREFGTDIPDTVELRVHDSTADMRYFVIPKRPAGTEGWSEERLATLASLESMVGVGYARSPEGAAAA